ncbi:MULTISPECIES: hypothetical protein [unclassified Polaribacter]|uniref:hypothetical protein n=1 Tax=unclassified Polaribacter TaxID=196858 RepID=UPI0011BE4DBD|nr:MULTISPECIES: hypothetical protein [unclassified Polaribacter]TXD47830.1 hypothetical protein ES043_18075 [Polaribacter sp. IC063]TXD54885.1 hypothetical protein ES044_18290 [Polaribacter sp. IC066]
MSDLIVKNQNHWSINLIPFDKSILKLQQKTTWLDYWFEIELELKKTKTKPKLIVLNKDGFWQFIDDLLRTQWNIETKIV